jgi:hypothetical protein
MAAKVTVVVTMVLGDMWFTEDQLQKMSDDEVVALVKEDIGTLLEGDWQVIRGEQ